MLWPRTVLLLNLLGQKIYFGINITFWLFNVFQCMFKSVLSFHLFYITIFTPSAFFKKGTITFKLEDMSKINFFLTIIIALFFLSKVYPKAKVKFIW